MPVIGVTGGIATGKSAFVSQLRELLPGATSFDADQTARDFTNRDAEVRSEIIQAFGAGIYSGAGDLNRTQLRAIVFADPGKRRALEQILHPRIRRQWTSEAESRRGSTELYLADIPLLYETGGELLCDRVLVVACSPQMQLQRLMTRSSLSTTAAAEMISAQMPLLGKIARADHVVWNNGPPSALAEQAKILSGLWER